MSAEGRNPKGDRSHILVLRLWFEKRRDSEGGGEWRGEVRDVTSRSRASFRHLEGLTAAVRELGLEGR